MEAGPWRLESGIKAVRQVEDFLAELKASGSLKKLVVTGCLAERYKEEVAEQFPEADAVIGIGDQANIAGVLDALTKDLRVTRFAPKCNMPLTGDRLRITIGTDEQMKCLLNALDAQD